MVHHSEVLEMSWFKMIACALVLLTVFSVVVRRRGPRADGGSFVMRFAFAVVLVLVVAAMTMRTSVVRHETRPAVIAVAEASGSSERPRDVPTKARNAKTAKSSKKGSWRPPEEAPAPPKEPSVPWKKTIEALGGTPEMALDEVWDQARTWLAHDLDLSTLPAREYVSEKLKLNKKNQSVTPGPEVDGVKTFQAHVELELTPEGWRELAAFERNWLARERTEFAFRALALITILLGAVAGYLRLDEWTKGYYTGRLRVLTVVIVAVAAVLIARSL